MFYHDHKNSAPRLLAPASLMNGIHHLPPIIPLHQNLSSNNTNAKEKNILINFQIFLTVSCGKHTEALFYSSAFLNCTSPPPQTQRHNFPTSPPLPRQHKSLHTPFLPPPTAEHNSHSPHPSSNPQNPQISNATRHIQPSYVNTHTQFSPFSLILYSNNLKRKKKQKKKTNRLPMVPLGPLSTLPSLPSPHHHPGTY